MDHEYANKSSPNDGLNLFHYSLQTKLLESPRFWLCVLYGLFGVIGNAFIFCCVTCSERMRTPTFIVVASLAFVDMLMVSCIFVTASEFHVPLYFIDKLSEKQWRSVLTFIETFQYILILCASLHLIVLMAVGYCVLVHILKTRENLPNILVIKLCLSCWILALSIVLVPIAAVNFPKEYDAMSSLIFASIFCALIYAVPVLEFLFLNVLKLRSILKALKAMHDSNSLKIARKLYLMVVVIALLHLVFLMPFTITIVYRHLGKAKNQGMHFLATFFLALDSCVNPWIYAVFSKAFRESMWPCRQRKSASYDVSLPRRRTI